MSLSDELKAYMSTSITKIPENTLEAFNNATEKLNVSGISKKAIGVGDTIPDIELPNAMGNQVCVNDLLSRGPVVVSFYRGSWCPYCNIELRALQSELAQINALGGSLVAITPETVDSLVSIDEIKQLSFHVLSDKKNIIAKAFGLVFKVEDPVNDAYRDFGINLELSNGDSSHELPMPATYVIASDHRVVHAFVDPDYTRRMEPDDIIACLKRLSP